LAVKSHTTCVIPICNAESGAHGLYRPSDRRPFAVIRVQDDGKGIPGDALPYIFEPFFTTKTIGTGLGLANVKQIAAAHQGRVEVVDIKPRGTAFEVLLPMGMPCQPSFSS
jgi:signal transduction histidine kinase